MSEALTRADTYIEDLLSWIPSEGRGFVQGLLSPLTQVLYEVTGDPDDLMRAAQVWADSSAEVEQAGQELNGDARYSANGASSNVTREMSCGTFNLRSVNARSAPRAF